jgi:hypothetical protein
MRMMAAQMAYTLMWTPNHREGADILHIPNASSLVEMRVSLNVSDDGVFQ